MIMGGEIYLPGFDRAWAIGRELGLQIAAHIVGSFGMGPTFDDLAGRNQFGSDNLFIHVTGMSDTAAGAESPPPTSASSASSGNATAWSAKSFASCRTVRRNTPSTSSAEGGGSGTKFASASHPPSGTSTCRCGVSGVTTRYVASIKYTLDERIEDGLYCAGALDRLRELVEDPAAWGALPSRDADTNGRAVAAGSMISTRKNGTSSRSDEPGGSA